MAIRTEQEALLDGIKNNTFIALSPAAADYIADTDEHTGPYFALTACGSVDAVIDVSECDMSFLGNVAANSGTDNITIPKGATIYGTFASVELDSGAVIGYKL
jgi:hypothetical protein